jgi:DNA-directed RNA polymerase specialized sigma24 family protein
MKPKSKSRGVGPAKQNELDLQFSQCLASLRLIAGRVLNGDDDVREAMRRSYLAAASQRWSLESDGEFRRWLVRTVLNEALMILHEKESGAESSGDRIFWQVCSAREAAGRRKSAVVDSAPFGLSGEKSCIADSRTTEDQANGSAPGRRPVC